MPQSALSSPPSELESYPRAAPTQKQMAPTPTPMTVSDNTVKSFLALDDNKKRETLKKLSDPAKRALLAGIKSRPPSPPTQQTPEEPSAATRFAGSATEAMGMPADIKQWPKAVSDLTTGPIPKNLDPTSGGLNAAINIGKGAITASRDTANIGMERMKQPGWENKLVGGMQYIASGIPILGPSLVKAGKQFEDGDYAGGFGTTTGVALQILSGLPEARENLAAVPGKLGAIPQTVARKVSGVGENVIEQAHKDWAKETLAAQAKHETKVAEILAEHKENTFDAWLEQAKKVQDQNTAHAEKIADINTKHAKKLADVRDTNEQAKSTFAEGTRIAEESKQQASQLAETLPELREKARAEAKAAYPQIEGTFDPVELHDDLQASVDEKLKGAGRVPSSLKRILDEIEPKPAPSPLEGASVFRGAGIAGRRGIHGVSAEEAISTMDPKVRARFLESLHPEERAGMEATPESLEDEKPTDFDKLHGFYSEIGREMSIRDLPGDERAALADAYNKIGKKMAEMAKAEGKTTEFESAQRGWKKLMNTFYNTDPVAKGGSPIARALQSVDPITGKLRPDYVHNILSDSKSYRIAQELLGRYTHLNAPVDLLQKMKENFDLAKTYPKNLKLAPTPTPPELPEKPETPEPKIPASPELPKAPEIEPFSATQHRLELLEKAAKRVQGMNRWEALSIGAGIVELMRGEMPLAWTYPAMRRIQSILMNSEAYRLWLSGERPTRFMPRDAASGRFRAISPLTMTATPPSLGQQSAEDMSPPPTP